MKTYIVHSRGPLSTNIIERIKQIFIEYPRNPQSRLKFEFPNYYRTLGNHIYFDNTDRSTVGVTLIEITVE